MQRPSQTYKHVFFSTFLALFWLFPTLSAENTGWPACLLRSLSKGENVENSADVPSSLTFTESDSGRALSQLKHSILITHKALRTLLKKKKSEHFVVNVSFKRIIKIDSPSWSSHKYPFRAFGTKFIEKILLLISWSDVICEVHLRTLWHVFNMQSDVFLLLEYRAISDKCSLSLRV